MENTQTNHSAYVDLLVSAICNLKRLPKGFSTAHSALDKAGKNSTGKLLLDHGGFATWLAYYAAKERGKTHFVGQAATNQSLNALDGEPDECLKSIAKKVKEGIPAEKRAEIERALKPRKRQRAQDNEPEDTDHQQKTSRLSSTALERVENSPSSTQQDVRYHIISRPLYSSVKNILPEEIVNGLKQLPSDGPDRVHITMSFPRAEHWGEAFDPQMVLHIENGINYIAWRLFHARIETSNGIQFLVLENGLKVESVDGIVLRGCRRKAIPKVFGATVAKAVQSSIVFTRERQEASLTEGVVMQIGRKVEDEASILLSVAEEGGIRLKEALWGK